MKQYIELVNHILEKGVVSEDRTGTGTLSVFGYQTRYDLSKGFPAVTTKKLAWRSMVAELMWFLEGSSDERRLAELTYKKHSSEISDKKTIWSNDAESFKKRDGYYIADLIGCDNVPVGDLYGYQWRQLRGVDQIRDLIDGLKNNPYSRRHIVNAWNPYVVKHQMAALEPCHVLSQYYVRDGKLSCLFYQRSADTMLGVPFNVSSYALLTHILARECDLQVGELIHSIGDAHIYLNHVDGAREQIERKPLSLPRLVISDDFNLEDTLEGKSSLNVTDHFTLEDYDHHSTIKFEMSF